MTENKEENKVAQASNTRQASQVRSLLLGGILPLVAYSVVEEVYGPTWGLALGMAFGIAEILYERLKMGKVETITWVGNGLLLALGGVSLLTQEGMWFKLQPAILEAVMGGMLIGSSAMNRPLLVELARKQRMLERFPPGVVAIMERNFAGFNLRVGLFFMVHAIIAAWAALHWSTRAWVLLKGIGFTGSLCVYALVEIWFMRRRLGRSSAPDSHTQR